MSFSTINYYPYNGLNPFFTIWVKESPEGRRTYGANDFSGNIVLQDLDHAPTLAECLAEFRVRDA
jgi:hypothetical protein